MAKNTTMFHQRYSIYIGVLLLSYSCSVLNFKNDEVENMVFEDAFENDSVVLFLNKNKVVDEILSTNAIIGKAKGYCVKYKKKNAISCIVNDTLHKYCFQKYKGDNYLFIEKYGDTVVFTLSKKPHYYF